MPMLCESKHQFDEARPAINTELGIDFPDLGANRVEAGTQIIRHLLCRATFQKSDGYTRLGRSQAISTLQ